MANVTEPLVGAREFFTLIGFVYHVWLAILTFGAASNCVNITVFFGFDERDSVSTSLLALSLSDLGYIVIASFSAVTRLLIYHHPGFSWNFDPEVFITCTYWYGQVFYDFSCFISVFLAAVRCCCVVMPLKFKTVFTKSRTVRTLIGLFIAAICLRAPQLYGHRFVWESNPATNRTSLTCSHVKQTQMQVLAKVNDIINRNILSWLAYITVFVCVVAMIVKLKAASRFRNSVSQVGSSKTYDTNFKRPDPDESNGTSTTSGSLPSSLPIRKQKQQRHRQRQHQLQQEQEQQQQQEQRQHKHSEKMANKEVQLIHSIILLSVIFLFSQLPFQVYSTIRLFNAEFDTFGNQVFLFGFASHVSKTFSFLNCSVNIFVYLTYNRKYRTRFFALLCPCKK